jgi:hypothetical protein
MSLRDKMLQDAGVYWSEDKIKKVLTYGTLFDETASRDLEDCLKKGLITQEEFRRLRYMSTDKEKIIKEFFKTVAPYVNSVLEEAIQNTENNLENSLIQEDIGTFSTILEDLRDKKNKLEGIL